MDDTSTPVCPHCGAALVITAAEAVPAAAAVDPEVFMALPYRTSSTARWVCRGHGDVGRVVVAVVDDVTEFVAPANDDVVA